MIKSRKNHTELLVLAGGFGTRLRSAVSDVPKPLASVAGAPYLQYLIGGWLDQGITRLTFLLHHQAHLIDEFLERQKGEGKFTNCEVRTLTEPEPLGTGGSVANAVQHFKLTGSFFVANADTWLGSTKELFDSSAPAMAIVKVNNTERYGRIQVQEQRIVAFEEKHNSSGSGWINAGLYHLEANLFNIWDGRPFSLECDLFTKLAETKQLHAVSLETDFIDIGIPEDYFRFCRWIESGKVGVL